MVKFTPAVLTKTIAAITKELSPRNRDIVSRRFGLRAGKPETLESIGSSYHITRERVRQIEAATMAHLAQTAKENKEITRYAHAVAETLAEAGGVMRQSDLFVCMTGNADANTANASLAFLLSLDDTLVSSEENDHLHQFWAVSQDHAKKFRDIAGTLAEAFHRHDTVVHRDQLAQFANSAAVTLPAAHLVSVLAISKEISSNIFEEVGLRQWAQVHPRGVRDKAYLVMKKQGAPRHFSAIANLINSASFSGNRSVNTQTVHNELIKDKRFVLVGRGLYALAEWGYKPGTVKEVLVDVLKNSSKPMTKVELVTKVLESRMVKENTIVLNLQDSRCFAKHDDGTFTLRKA
ncbi:MAG: sigma factor-like helix-turn-helix DNA-binding protein [Patescibacteria group bacterium]